LPLEQELRLIHAATTIHGQDEKQVDLFGSPRASRDNLKMSHEGRRNRRDAGIKAD
jgi:hypothetical protein